MQFRVYREYGLLLHLLSEKGNMYSTMRIFRHVRIHGRVQALQKGGMTMANIPKAAMRATNNVMRGYIPHNGIVSAGAKRNADKEVQNMGRRKNRHCQSKQEVINRELLKRQQSGSRTKSTVINQLHTINQLRPAMEQARNTMREKNRRESKNDIV